MYNEPRIYAYSFAACAYVRGRLWNPPGSDLNPSPPAPPHWPPPMGVLSPRISSFR